MTLLEASSRHMKRRIETLIQEPRRGNRTPLEWALAGASCVYAAVVTARNAVFDSGMLGVCRLPVPVISVGNITVGGTGKTPMAMYLAEWLQEEGRRPVIVSRGYGGNRHPDIAVVSDGESLRMGPEQSGDEPYLMALRLPGVPVVVGRRRSDAGRYALRQFSPDMLILDDAYQHRRIQRDINLLLLDGNRPFGNGYSLPRGPLREPKSGGSRADGIVFTRADGIQVEELAASVRAAAALVSDIPAFACDHIPAVRGIVRSHSGKDSTAEQSELSTGVVDLEGEPSFGFSGLANNDNFRYTLGRLRPQVVGFSGFSDHHRYTAEELDGLQAQARTTGARYLITTEKDMVRIPAGYRWRRDVVVVGIQLAFGADEAAFRQFILKRLLAADEEVTRPSI
jgi:tetraacyldisaccharide 4'-kinase